MDKYYYVKNNKIFENGIEIPLSKVVNKLNSAVGFIREPKCKCKNLIHIEESNSFPYGEDISYDKCKDCGKLHNFKIER